MKYLMITSEGGVFSLCKFKTGKTMLTAQQVVLSTMTKHCSKERMSNTLKLFRCVDVYDEAMYDDDQDDMQEEYIC